MYLDSVFQKRISSCALMVALLDLTVVNRVTSDTCADLNTLRYTEGIGIENHATSHVEMHTTPFKASNGKIALSVKTCSLRGLIFFATVKEDTNSILALTIQRGHLYLTARCSSGTFNEPFPYFRVNDGKWHNIEYTKTGSNVLMHFDGRRADKEYALSCKPNYFEFGGISQKYYYKLYNEVMEYAGQFVGCIGNLRITDVDVTGNVVYRSVSSCEVPKCPEM